MTSRHQRGLPFAVAAASSLVGSSVAAHQGHSFVAGAGSSSWAWEAWLFAILTLLCTAYFAALLRLWSRAGVGAGIHIWQACAFGIGWLALASALLPPLDRLGSERFWIHMIQHEVLMLVAAPLLVLGQPQAALVWLLPIPLRRSIGGAPVWHALRSWALALTHPFVAWLLFALVLWLWHVPVFFESALADEAVHALQHVSFLLAGFVFWRSLLHRHAKGPRGGAALLSLFGTAVHGSILGALLTFAPSVWYQAYVAETPGPGLTPLEDQQLGGLIMWVPAGMIYLAAALGLATYWLRDCASRVRRRPSASLRLRP